MKISEHFNLEEFSFSAAAARLGLDNIPGSAVISNLSLVAAVMERIRTLLGDRPLFIHSGYRSAELNRAVGGVATSAHCQGLACDFVCPTFGTPAEVAEAILKSGYRIRPAHSRVRMDSCRLDARGNRTASAGSDKAFVGGSV